jgi:hypothetical protein
LLQVDRPIDGTADLTHGGTQYHVADLAPEAADGALGEILEALKRQDWGALYDLSYSGLQESVTRPAFVQQMTAAWAGRGVVTSVGVTIPPQLGSGRPGYDSATAVAFFVLTENGLPTTYIVDVTMVWESSGWRFVTIDKRL